MLNKMFLESSIPKELVSIADCVAYNRPPALRQFDQIYMMSGDMLSQVELVKDYLIGKRIVFLGDGDGMSMLFGLLAAKKRIESPKSMTVLDFDKRILSNINHFAKEYDFKGRQVILHTESYNVANPIPSKLSGTFDYFYINPPYGSKNKGLSTIVWLHRCMELCSYSSSGCIVVPYDDKEPWSQDAMLHIQKFLSEKGFVVRDMVSNMHQYHLKDNPVLQSAAIIVDRIAKADSEYAGEHIPKDKVKELYGKPIAIPQYIEKGKDENIFGTPVYDWEYGKDKFWEET